MKSQILKILGHCIAKQSLDGEDAVARALNDFRERVEVLFKEPKNAVNQSPTRPKYSISKTNSDPIDPNAVYFVMRLDKPDDHGRICRRLVSMYAEAVLATDPDASTAAMDCVKTGHATAASRSALRAIKAMCGINIKETK